MIEPGRSSPLDLRRRKLRFRSWHRGIREMDLIMGRFADACLDELTEADLDGYETLLDVADQDLFSWVIETHPLPPQYDIPVFRKLSAFHRSTFNDDERA
jgi:antitoxin CptB